MNYLLVIVCYIAMLLPLGAQKRISINGIDLIDSKKFFKSSSSGVVNGVPAYCINFFANNKKFIAIDRQNLTLINKEKELQKSEDFIDGYIVEQGKSEGVDLSLKAIYYEDKKVLNIKIYDIHEGTIKCSSDKILDSNMFGVKKLEQQIHYMLHEMMFDCFEIKFPIVRAIDQKGDKIKEALVAMGKKHKVIVEDYLELFIFKEEEIDGEKLSRKVIVGEGIVKEIQDENFSTISIKKGNKEIAELMSGNQKVYSRIIYKD